MGPKMSSWPNANEDDTTRLVVAITDFLREQLETRTDLVPEDRDCLEIAIQCLEMAYGLDANGYLQYRFARPLIDIFNQVTNPVSVKDKLQAEVHKDEGNAYMRRSMHSEAEASYTRAIELDKWNSVYYCNRASSRIEQRNFFEAISDCRQALLLNPDYSKAHARMGQAYVMIHRPREAARCFRQALDLEPDNERYRNNLRVAEGQIHRPDAAGLITSVLNSIFGLRPQTSEDNAGVMLPPSFMIITEHHPPSRHPTNVQNQQNADKLQERSQTGAQPGIELNDIEFPPPYGVFDEGAEEQPTHELDMPSVVQSMNESDDNLEFSIEIPLFSFLGGHHSDTCFCQRSETTEQVGELEEIADDIQSVQGEIMAVTGEIEGDERKQIHEDTTEILEKDSKPPKITSEITGQESSMTDTKPVEKIKEAAENGERNGIWKNITDTVESLVTAVENGKNINTIQAKSTKDLNETPENKTNSVLKDVIESLDSVVTNVETTSQAVISTDGKESEKSSRNSEEFGKNLQSTDSIGSKTFFLFGPHSHSDAEQEYKTEITQPEQTPQSKETDEESTRYVQQDHIPLVPETIQILPSSNIGEENSENTEHDSKTLPAGTDDAKEE